MRAAISILDAALDAAETNEPISRQENRIAQADLEAKTAAELRQALGLLRAHVAYRDPVYPAPKAI